MSQALVERFRELRLEWARSEFAQELRTDFQRSRKFDSPLTAEVVSVLRRQPPESLKVLAEVLPLDVFTEAPDTLERRSRLADRARRAVERFRSEYDREVGAHFDEGVRFLARRHDKRVQRDFRAAVRTGNGMVMEIADRWKSGVDGGAPGEWGLIFKRDWGRLTVSLNLSRQMTVSYSISLSNPSFSTIGRWHDDFLIALGICGSASIVESPEKFPEKLSQLSDFAWWHLNEYEKIISKIQNEEGPFLTKGH